MSKRELVTDDATDKGSEYNYKYPRSMQVDGEQFSVCVRGQVFTFDRSQLETRYPDFLEKMKRYQTSDHQIIVDDVDTDVFRILHRFMQNNFTSSDLQHNINKMYHAAKRFGVKGLLTKCVQYMRNHLSKKNVFFVLDYAINTGDNNTRTKCIELISRELPHVMNSQSFCNLTEDCLLEILRSERTTVPEEKVFFALVKWAEYQCSSRDLEQDVDNKRLLMSEALKLVQFPRMKSGVFMNKVCKSGILTQDQIIDHLRFFLERDMSLTQNPSAQDAMEQGENELFTVKRFQSVTSGKYYVRDNKDAISFTCNMDSLLHGILLFGSHQRPGNYSIDISIRDEQDCQLHAQNDHLVTDGNRRIYEIIISPYVKISKDKKYTVSLLMKGICSYFGKDGLLEVSHGDFRIKFTPSLQSLNGTNVLQGQIPGLILQKVQL